MEELRLLWGVGVCFAVWLGLVWGVCRLGKGMGYFRFGVFLLMELILLHGDDGP